MADSADEVVGGGTAFGHRDDFDRGRLIVGAEDQVRIGLFDVSDGASIVFQNSVHIEIAFAIGLK